MARRSGMLRLSSIDQLEQYSDTPQARRERFNSGLVRVPEREILSGCLQLMQHHPRVAFAKRVNVGSGFLLYRDTYERLVREGHLQKNEARYVQYGVKGGADITSMLRGGRRLEVETKADRGKVSDDQQIFGDAVNGGGGLWVVVRSVDELVHVLATT